MYSTSATAPTTTRPHYNRVIPAKLTWLVLGGDSIILILIIIMLIIVIMIILVIMIIVMIMLLILLLRILTMIVIVVTIILVMIVGRRSSRGRPVHCAPRPVNRGPSGVGLASLRARHEQNNNDYYYY